MNKKDIEKKQEEVINLYYDGALDAETTAAVEELIAEDETWSEAFTNIQRVDDALKSLHADDMEIDISEQFDLSPFSGSGFLQQLKEMFLRPALSPALAAVIVLIFAGFYFLLPSVNKSFQVVEKPLVSVSKSDTGVTNKSNALVRFVLYAPDAKRVDIIGGFNGWKTGVTPLNDIDGDGFWAAMVSLKPGEHEYQFVIDEKDRIVDPLAQLIRPDGFGGKNAVLSF